METKLARLYVYLEERLGLAQLRSVRLQVCPESLFPPSLNENSSAGCMRNISANLKAGILSWSLIATAALMIFWMLLRGRIEKSSLGLFSENLSCPEEVDADGRNFWITQAALLCKWSGVSEERAMVLLEKHIRQIPDFRSSRNCRHFRSIIKSLYRSRPETLGQDPECAPAWLLQEPKLKKSKPKNGKFLFSKKSRPTPQSALAKHPRRQRQIWIGVISRIQDSRPGREDSWVRIGAEERRVLGPIHRQIRFFVGDRIRLADCPLPEWRAYGPGGRCHAQEYIADWGEILTVDPEVALTGLGLEPKRQQGFIINSVLRLCE